jgi:putative transposase
MSLAQAIGRADFRYARYINRLHGRQGHLWQERFYSCALDEKHAVAAMRYVEQNPVRAHITRLPWTYPWSSAAAHIGQGDQWGLLDLKAWRAEWSSEEWKEMLKTSVAERVVASIRYNTMHCRPLGSDGFVSKIETVIGRRLRPSPVGRPKGWKKG